MQKKSDIKVKYVGPFTDETGYGEANRNFIRALDEAGVGVNAERVSYTKKNSINFGENTELCKSLEGNPVKYDIKIVHVPSDSYMKFLEPTKYHIGHLFWETDRMSESWVWNCNLMDEIWTGAPIHKDHFAKSGVKVPIYTFPEPIDTDIKFQPPFSLPDHKGFLFYSIFEWIERKNPKGLLQAYWKEFQGEENVSLLIKTYKFGFSADEKEAIRNDIRAWKEELKLESYPRVFLYLDMVDKLDIMKLHCTGDCFVLPHRGEGWGIPIAEAMVFGKPVITTWLGGINEYLTKKNALLLKYEKINVFNMDFAPWYKTNQMWANPIEEDLREKMRFVFENPEEATQIGKEARAFVKDQFSYWHVGTLMKNRLMDIQRLIDGQRSNE